MTDDSMMTGDEKPVTRRELREEFARFRVEMTHEIASAMNYVVERNQTAIDRAIEAALAAHMSREMSRMAQAVAEAMRQEIAALDDRYRDLPGRVSLLERELDDHRGDRAIHLAPGPRRRTRR
jgi:hypothetical protein